MEMSREDFERLVAIALDTIPAELTAMMDNVVVLVEDDSPPGPVLFGLYEGTPLTQRGDSWAAGALPDRITIFRIPILAACLSAPQALNQVRITVVHEIAHHFGISDARLDELGWG